MNKSEDSGFNVIRQADTDQCAKRSMYSKGPDTDSGVVLSPRANST
jgi:hypothetical protein